MLLRLNAIVICPATAHSPNAARSGLKAKPAGVSAELAGYDDLIAYLLFEKEIARRGEALSEYLIDDEAGWPQRTSHRKYDYKWGLYEAVVKSVFLRLVGEHPLYVLKSIFFYERWLWYRNSLPASSYRPPAP
jgi:hypothetical protein